MSNEIKTTGNISFLGLLTIVFITLKLCNVINWSWIWILSPLWIGIAVLIFFFVLLLLIASIVKK